MGFDWGMRAPGEGRGGRPRDEEGSPGQLFLPIELDKQAVGPFFHPVFPILIFCLKVGNS